MEMQHPTTRIILIQFQKQQTKCMFTDAHIHTIIAQNIGSGQEINLCTPCFHFSDHSKYIYTNTMPAINLNPLLCVVSSHSSNYRVRLCKISTTQNLTKLDIPFCTLCGFITLCNSSHRHN